MAYKKPTLTETYAELRLAEGGLSEARFFDVVPTLRARGFTEIEFATSGVRLEFRRGEPFPREQQRVRCWKPGRTELVQVAEDLIIANLTGQYPGWDTFLRLFDQSCEAVQISLPEAKVESLSLNTIDSFRVPKEAFRSDSYFAVGGEIIPDWYRSITASFDIDIGRGLLEVDGVNEQVHISAKAANDPVLVTVHCHFQERLTAEHDIRALLERLHSKSNATFEALITDRLRNEIMGGKK